MIDLFFELTLASATSPKSRIKVFIHSLTKSKICQLRLGSHVTIQSYYLVIMNSNNLKLFRWPMQLFNCTYRPLIRILSLMVSMTINPLSIVSMWEVTVCAGKNDLLLTLRFINDIILHLEKQRCPMLYSFKTWFPWDYTHHTMCMLEILEPTVQSTPLVPRRILKMSQNVHSTVCHHWLSILEKSNRLPIDTIDIGIVFSIICTTLHLLRCFVVLLFPDTIEGYEDLSANLDQQFMPNKFEETVFNWRRESDKV